MFFNLVQFVCSNVQFAMSYKFYAHILGVYFSSKIVLIYYYSVLYLNSDDINGAGIYHLITTKRIEDHSTHSIFEVYFCLFIGAMPIYG